MAVEDIKERKKKESKEKKLLLQVESGHLLRD